MKRRGYPRRFSFSVMKTRPGFADN